MQDAYVRAFENLHQFTGKAAFATWLTRIAVNESLRRLKLRQRAAQKQTAQDSSSDFVGTAESNAKQMIEQGRQIFRFDTFGDEAFWGDTLKVHQTINDLPPRQALALGLKVDSGPSGAVGTLPGKGEGNAWRFAQLDFEHSWVRDWQFVVAFV